MNLSPIVTVGKYLGAVCLAFVIWWHVAEHLGPRQCHAIVHVTEPDVVVTVDDREFPVDSLEESPLICELGPGEHLLRMSREGRLIYEEKFTVKRGKDKILAAYDPRARKTPRWKSRVIAPSGFAIRAARLAPMHQGGGPSDQRRLEAAGLSRSTSSSSESPG